MLIGRPTKYGTGIEIFGDYLDLKSLYDSVHFLAGEEDALGYDLFMCFAYDIRKANFNQRETETFHFDNEPIVYKGVKIFWAYILITVKFMRENAGLMLTKPEIQADIYRLEAIVESCLKSYDLNIGTQIFDWLTLQNIPRTEYIELLVSHITFKNLQAKNGKPRFRKLNKGIKSLLLKHPDHKDFKKLVDAETKRLNCNIKDLGLDEDFDETGFKW